MDKCMAYLKKKLGGQLLERGIEVIPWCSSTPKTYSVRENIP